MTRTARSAGSSHRINGLLKPRNGLSRALLCLDGEPDVQMEGQELVSRQWRCAKALNRVSQESLLVVAAAKHALGSRQILHSNNNFCAHQLDVAPCADHRRIDRKVFVYGIDNTMIIRLEKTCISHKKPCTLNRKVVRCLVGYYFIHVRPNKCEALIESYVFRGEFSSTS